PHAVERRQSHPHSDSAADGRAPQRAGQSRAQVRRRRARGDPACAHRDDEPDQEDRARLLRRPEACREGSAEDARRSPQGGGRGGEGQRSRDPGSLMLSGPIPRHVAIIMDGNGRWASERRLPRPFGHRAGMKAVRETAGGQKLSLNLCISYSSRGEIAHAARLLAEEVLKGTKQLEDIDEEAIRAKLYTAPWGDPDLLIRTSGEQRLSNFLLWQLAY